MGWFDKLFGDNEEKSVKTVPSTTGQSYADFAKSWLDTDDHKAAVQKANDQLEKAAKLAGRKLSAKESREIGDPTQYSPAYDAFIKSQKKKKVPPKEETVPTNLLKQSIEQTRPKAKGGKVKKKKKTKKNYVKKYANGGTIRKPRRA